MRTINCKVPGNSDVVTVDSTRQFLFL